MSTVRGTINGEPYEVPEGYDVVSEKARFAGVAALTLLQDLDRSPHGRHRGDVESQDPTGFSQGNPCLNVGTHIGFTISGQRIVVPEDDSLGDPHAWVESKAETHEMQDPRVWITYIENLEDALRTIRGPEDRGPWILIYREAGGGYQGLQAIAEAALEQCPADGERHKDG